jgi:hypothetical protein
MGAAINQLEMHERLHSMVYSPIHTYFGRLIPYLEKRQEVAKRLYSCKEPPEEYEQLIKYINDQIKLILDIPQEIQST